MRPPANSSTVIAGQLPGSPGQETLVRLRIEADQLAITRAMAGAVMPNYSPAVQIAMEQDQQAITRAMTEQPLLEVTPLQDVAPATSSEQSWLDMTRITADTA